VEFFLLNAVRYEEIFQIAFSECANSGTTISFGESEICMGCETCVEICPRGAILLDEKKAKVEDFLC